MPCTSTSVHRHTKFLLNPVSYNFFFFGSTVVEGEQKAPFSIATTQRCTEDANPFPGLHHFTLDTYLILLSVKQGGIKYHF